MGFQRRPASLQHLDRRPPDRGEFLVTDGPYVEGKEHIGGFLIIKAADLDAALEWARKMAKILTPLSIEVRPFQHT